MTWNPLKVFLSHAYTHTYSFSSQALTYVIGLTSNPIFSPYTVCMMWAYQKWTTHDTVNRPKPNNKLNKHSYINTVRIVANYYQLLPNNVYHHKYNTQYVLHITYVHMYFIKYFGINVCFLLLEYQFIDFKKYAFRNINTFLNIYFS